MAIKGIRINKRPQKSVILKHKAVLSPTIEDEVENKTEEPVITEDIQEETEKKVTKKNKKVEKEAKTLPETTADGYQANNY